MQYQLFRGVDVREALKAVKAAFGPDAVIHSTREISNGRGGALGATFIEVAAAPATDVQRWPFKEARGGGGGARRESTRARARSLGKGMGVTRTLGLDAREIERELSVLRSMLEDLNASRPPRQRAYSIAGRARRRGHAGSGTRERFSASGTSRGGCLEDMATPAAHGAAS